MHSLSSTNPIGQPPQKIEKRDAVIAHLSGLQSEHSVRLKQFFDTTFYGPSFDRIAEGMKTQLAQDANQSGIGSSEYISQYQEKLLSQLAERLVQDIDKKGMPKGESDFLKEQMIVFLQDKFSEKFDMEVRDRLLVRIGR